MNDNQPFDVFISCKSEDYPLGGEVYDFLTSEGYNVFFADRTLSKLGESEYADVIDEVLDEVRHLIVVSSNGEYIKSKWVKAEWQMFLNEIRSERKEGNIVTVLKDVPIKDIPISLRHLQSFTFEDYKTKVLGYLPVNHELAKHIIVKDGKKHEEKALTEEELYIKCCLDKAKDLMHLYDDQEADDIAALEWLHKAADAGSGEALCLLGEAYKYGNGVEINLNKSARYFTKSASAGYDMGIVNYAWAYLYGLGLKQDIKKGLKILKDASEDGCAAAMYYTAIAYLDEELFGKRDYIKILDWCNRAAKFNYPQAEEMLGNFYQFGDGVEASTPTAIEHYKKSLELGNNNVLVPLAKLTFGEESLNYWKKAADAGIEIAVSRINALQDIENNTHNHHFDMIVEDVFSINGRGTVLTGMISEGYIRVGDDVTIFDETHETKATVTGVECFRKILPQGLAGDNVGLLLSGVDKNEVKRDFTVMHTAYVKERGIEILRKELYEDVPNEQETEQSSSEYMIATDKISTDCEIHHSTEASDEIQKKFNELIDAVYTVKPEKVEEFFSSDWYKEHASTSFQLKGGKDIGVQNAVISLHQIAQSWNLVHDVVFPGDVEDNLKVQELLAKHFIYSSNVLSIEDNRKFIQGYSKRTPKRDDLRPIDKELAIAANLFNYNEVRKFLEWGANPDEKVWSRGSVTNYVDNQIKKLSVKVKDNFQCQHKNVSFEEGLSDLVSLACYIQLRRVFDETPKRNAIFQAFYGSIEHTYTGEISIKIDFDEETDVTHSTYQYGYKGEETPARLRVKTIKDFFLGGMVDSFMKLEDTPEINEFNLDGSTHRLTIVTPDGNFNEISGGDELIKSVPAIAFMNKYAVAIRKTYNEEQP